MLRELTSSLKLRRCLNVPPTIPGTPAILSNRMIRINHCLFDNSWPLARSSATGGGLIASIESGMGIAL